MSIYEPGDALVAYDIVAPLQYTGFKAYKKDYQEFLDQFEGPVDVTYPDVKILAGDTVAFSHGLERMTGTLKNGQKFDAWVRLPRAIAKRMVVGWRSTTTYPCPSTSIPAKRC
jgi:ketosteroid isomerase-like protein